MKFALLASITALATAALAAPADKLAERSLSCISQSQAEKFIERFNGVLTKQGSDLGDYLTTVDKLLAPNFQEISDSINSLAGFPVHTLRKASSQTS